MSTASLIVGVAGSGAAASIVRTAGISGLVAGALAMAAGEYVSVAAQRDAERADLARERQELQEHPISELAELAEIWRHRGLTPELAQEVAEQLTDHDALAAHARDELGLSAAHEPRPVQAALASAVSFATGALVPLLAFIVWRAAGRSAFVIGVATVALAGSGALGAILGGAAWRRAAARVAAGGVVAMLITLAIGELTGAALG